MPVKKDENGKRWVEMELIVPGTPEQVWQAMATGPGNTAWFTKARIDERVGGEIFFDFGPNGSSTGEVTVWEPPLSAMSSVTGAKARLQWRRRSP